MKNATQVVSTYGGNDVERLA